MNGLERLIASGNGKPTDCVPVAPGVGHYAAYQAREPMTRVAYDPELMARVVLQALEQHDYDACSPITDYGIGTESMGSRSVIRDWEQTFVAEYAVQTRADVSRLRLPNPLRAGRMPVIIGCEQILVETVGDRVGVNGGLAGALSFAANLRGPQQTLYDVREDPALVHELVRLGAEAAKSFGEAQIVRGGVKTINVYDPLAALISPAMADEFCFPYLTEVIAHLKTLGATVLLHICNDTTRVIERMIGTGADILSVDAQVDLGKAKELARGRVSFSGNVATQRLSWYDADAIYEETCRVIAGAAAGGRFTVSSSCEVPIETPAVNIDAMVRAARVYGAEFLSRDGAG
jgi:uroporphyrinogen decarboxylase